MSKLLQIAAKLVTLPQEDAPEYLYAGCKQIAAEIRDFHDTELAAKSAECEAAVIERDALLAENAKLKAMLRTFEWCNQDCERPLDMGVEAFGNCYYCGAFYKAVRHNPDCELAALLNEKGGE